MRVGRTQEDGGLCPLRGRGAAAAGPADGHRDLMYET